jgi:hypothetical protein
MLAKAISFLSSVGILVLDRLDVLDLAGRTQALRWLSGLSSSTGTILVLGT